MASADESFDLDGDGGVSAAELEIGLRVSDAVSMAGVSNATATTLVDVFDADGDGKQSATELSWARKAVQCIQLPFNILAFVVTLPFGILGWVFRQLSAKMAKRCACSAAVAYFLPNYFLKAANSASNWGAVDATATSSAATNMLRISTFSRAKFPLIASRSCETVLFCGP